MKVQLIIQLILKVSTIQRLTCFNEVENLAADILDSNIYILQCIKWIFSTYKKIVQVDSAPVPIADRDRDQYEVSGILLHMATSLQLHVRRTPNDLIRKAANNSSKNGIHCDFSDILQWTHDHRTDTDVQPDKSICFLAQNL